MSEKSTVSLLEELDTMIKTIAATEELDKPKHEALPPEVQNFIESAMKIDALLSKSIHLMTEIAPKLNSLRESYEIEQTGEQS